MERVDPGEVGLNADALERMPRFFDTYLEKRKLPCMAMLVARGGKVAHFSLNGSTEMGGPEPIREDTIYRIYSMTKPITTVAAMMLFEEGKLRLDHELYRYIPEFSDVTVFNGGTAEAPKLKKPERPIMIGDLMIHTSGLSYAFLMQTEVDAYYRANRIDYQKFEGDLEAFCKKLATAPLVFSPGERWNYSNATDVLGRVVEVASGMKLDEFFATRIFKPLGMDDTGFHVPEDKIDRLMACYVRDDITGEVTLQDKKGAGSSYAKPPNVLSGGGGLASTISDYLKFTQMLLDGGASNGARILSPKTLEFMQLNHLPGGKTIAQMGDKTFSEARMDGSGFGLGWAVTTDVVATQQPASVGTYSWGGMASTFFWVDPAEDLIAIQATQLVPSGAYPIRPQMQQLVYAAIDD